VRKHVRALTRSTKLASTLEVAPATACAVDATAEASRRRDRGT
jgi:hypothetical protein